MKLFRSPEQWRQGLKGMAESDVTQGALFFMHQAAPWPIEMAGMNFPIDVYWLAESGMVLEHAELFPGMPTYVPDVSARYVLELPMRERPVYKVGDFVELPHDSSADSGSDSDGPE